MKKLVHVLVLGLTVLFTVALCGCEKRSERSERASTGISDKEYRQQREARIQAREARIQARNERIEKNEKAREAAKRRAARKAAGMISTYSETVPMARTTSRNSQRYGVKRPSGVTTIGGLDYWSGNLPTKGGNSFIIMEQFGPNDCGLTSAEMVLYYYRKWVTQSDIWNSGDIHTIVVGTFPAELKQAFNGLGVPVLWLGLGTTVRMDPLSPLDMPSANYNPFSSLKRKIRQSKPCIILLQGGLKSYHWVVVVGYDNQNRFLIADPSGHFEWWDKQKLDRYWGFKNASGHGIEGAFFNTAVHLNADPYTMIVPKDPPKGHFDPMWSDMQHIQVTGSSRRNFPNINPLHLFSRDKRGFRTEAWKHTFHFPEEYASPDYYTIACLQPLQVKTVFTKGYVEMHSSTTKGEITVSGQIEYGKYTRSKLWIVVRVFRKGIKPWVAPRVIPG